MTTATRLRPGSVFDGEPLLRTIATAVTVLGRRRTPGEPVYDAVVQRAFDQLVLLCIRRGLPPPGSVPEMSRWARTFPLSRWPLDLLDAEVTDEEFLVDAQTGTPTQACLEWALSTSDPTSEQFENLVMHEAIGTCRAARSPGSYTALRRLLIERPVLTTAQLAELASEIDLHPVLEIVKKCYEPTPASYLRDGRYATCARCGCLLVPVAGQRFRCELDRCKRDGVNVVGDVLDPHTGGGLHYLRRPLRVFVTGPGLAEIDLEQGLVKLGLRPEMWPNYDAYDLRIGLPNGQVWAIDVKDRANPALLGRTTTAFRTTPSYTKAFLVVPAYRLTDREDYQRVFARNLPNDLRGLVVMRSDKAILSRARTELARSRRGGGASGRGDERA
jgi:hypothetical protein